MRAITRAGVAVACATVITFSGLVAPGKGSAAEHRGHRASIDYAVNYLQTHYFGPYQGTHNMRGYVFNTHIFHYANGSKYWTFTLKAQRDPLTPTAQPSSQRRFCWNPFDGNCQDWNWIRVWDDITGGNSVFNKLKDCARGIVTGSIGNMNKASFTGAVYWATARDLSDTVLLRSNPAGLAVGSALGCTWQMWLDQ